MDTKVAKGLKAKDAVAGTQRFIQDHMQASYLAVCAAFALVWFYFSAKVTYPGEVELLYPVLAQRIMAGFGYGFGHGPSLVLPVMPYAISSLMAFGFGSLAAFKAISVTSGFLAAVLTYYVAKDMTDDPRVAYSSVVLLLSNTVFFRYSLDFYRESLFSLLVLAWFLAITKERTFAASVLVGVASLLRDQGVFLIPIGAVLLILRGRKRTAFPYAFLSAVIPAAWFARNVLVLTDPPYMMSFSELLAKPYLAYLPGYSLSGLLRDSSLPMPHILLFLVAAYMLSYMTPLLAFQAFQNNKANRDAFAFTVLYLLSHITVIGGMANVVRYLMLLAPFFCIFAAQGLVAASKHTGARDVFILFVVLALAVPQLNDGRLYLRGQQENRLNFIRIADWLNENVPQGSDVVVVAHSADNSYVNPLIDLTECRLHFYAPAVEHHSRYSSILTQELYGEAGFPQTFDEYLKASGADYILLLDDSKTQYVEGKRLVKSFDKYSGENRLSQDNLLYRAF